MKKTVTLIAILSLCVMMVGCGKRTGRQAKVADADSNKTTPEEVISPPESGIITVDMEGKDNIVLNVLKKKGETITIKLTLDDDYDHLSAVLTSEDPAANIRFSQIVMPDGSADGPFGREIGYDLTQKGECSLLLNENIMAGDPWEGVFTLGIKLLKK